jgi:hypothetical protein
VVDDDSISLAPSRSLEKAKLKSVGVRTPLKPPPVGEQLTHFLMDMPNANGFELCRTFAPGSSAKRRPSFRHQPERLENRANSTMSGQRLHRQTIPFIEPAVKALAHVLRGQLN